MAHLVHHLISQAAQRTPDAQALCDHTRRINYAELAAQVQMTAIGLQGLGIERHQRVAVYLDKRIETVLALFGAAAAGAVFVPINPLLKPEQVAYILRDCNVKILITSTDRFAALASSLSSCDALASVVVVGAELASRLTASVEFSGKYQLLPWDTLSQSALSSACSTPRVSPLVNYQLDSEMDNGVDNGVDTDMAAILYTSGSTGKPKGVVLSHRNLIAGAVSVATYLQNTADDRLLAVLPLSFDYGLSQLTTAFYVGASVVLLNYLLPRDIVNAVEDEHITGLAAVPPLWIQLAQQSWPAASTLRYLTNSGGAMPTAITDRLRAIFPQTELYLMYGLTEAFRSTFLPPDQLDRRPDSIGKAIPNAEILVLRPDGSACAANEPGELVHRGALVAQGYWNDPQKTAERFRPLPLLDGLTFPEIAVWSGDTVRRDEDGYLYFVGRTDELIKVSGYRISPTEVEEVLSHLTAGSEVVAIGVPHPTWGQAIVAIIHDHPQQTINVEQLRKECQRHLPAYMVPAHWVIEADSLPRNPNGKVDRNALKQRFADHFCSKASPDAS